MRNHSLTVINGRIITPAGIVEGSTLTTAGTKIATITPGKATDHGGEVIDAEGNYISPGFIDLHVHGGGGHDFMDGSVDAFLKIAETHARYGTTSMMPTTLSGSRDAIIHSLECYNAAQVLNKHGAHFLGMHLEGPYFAMNQRGAQDPRFIRNPDPEEYKDILNRFPSVKRWSAAPELPGALEFGNYARSAGVLVSLAHTDAGYEEAVAGFRNGYSLVTHLYSAMTGVTRKNAYRYAGAVEAAFVLDDMDVEIIADGIHLPAPLLKLVHKIKGPGRTILVTDAMRAAGMPPGPSVLGNIHDGLAVIVEDGVAKLPDRSAFAGSVATADQLVRNMITLAEVSLQDAVAMMSSTPARIARIANQTGSLAPGKDADIIIFDEDIRVKKTIVQGVLVY
jgi:N-acetylglucosamine-6-phosphate deacetylase